jgi:cell division GTPase FtsZ|tara:strand:+ start:1398 stop:2765 length:1368 start_codon:yes stop_codon:yes gene_type:complete
MSEDTNDARPTDEELRKSIDAAAGEPAESAPVPDAPAPTPVVHAVSAPVPPAVSAPAPSSSTIPGLNVVNVANIAAVVAPGAHQQAAKQVVVEDAHGYDVAFNMAFLGAGQGGGRLAAAFHTLGYRRVSCINTTDTDFEGLPEEVHRHSLDVGGAAKDAQFAADSLDGREEEVWDLLQRSWGNDIDYGLICAGLGGGTGSGLSPKLVEIARKYMESKGHAPRVGVILSLPETGEGQQVCRNALQGLKKILDMKVSPVVLVDNFQVRQLYKPGFLSVHSTINSTVSQLFHIFNQLAAVHSPFVTFDRSELAQLLDHGIVVMGASALESTQITSPADISQAIRDQLSSSVLAEVDLRKGKKGAVLFVGDHQTLDQLSMDFFDAGFTQMSRTLGSAVEGANTVVHRGVYAGTAPGLQMYAMISELEAPVKKLAEMAKEAAMDKSVLESTVAKFLGVDG